MISCRSSGDISVKEDNLESSALFIIAPQTTVSFDRGMDVRLARPNAPPIVRKKFLAPVTTARSLAGEVACAATKATISHA